MGKCQFDNEDEKFLNAWTDLYPAISQKKSEASWEKFKQNVIERNGRNYKSYFTKAGLAAVLLVFFSGYFFFEIYNPIITIPNWSHMDKEIILPDESLVLLKPGSEIKFRKNFRKSRNLKLKGRAFFDVVSDSLNKFTVTTKFTSTTVIGTSFSITESDFRDTHIALHTGKVLVSVKGFARSWSMVEGENFYFENGRTFLVRNPRLSFKKGFSYMDIDNTELDIIFEFLEERFGFKFLTANSGIRKTRVTLRIDVADSLKDIIELLSIINNLNYEMKKETKEIQIFSK